MRRLSSRDGSAVIQPCCFQYAAAERIASRETFHVDGARLAHCMVNQAANRSGSVPGGASAPNSVTIQRRIRPYVRRVLACSAPRKVAR